MASRDDALAYYDKGYSIIPEVDKSPVTKWKQYQAERPSLAQVNFWWPETPGEWPEHWGHPGGHDIGVICGSASGLVVIDADDQMAVDYCLLHLPPTPTRVLTSRGMHFYYRHPAGQVQNRQLNRESNDSPHIDIKGDGGKVTGIGSRHRLGHIYCLAPDAVLLPASELPAYDRAWFPKPRRAIPLVAAGHRPRVGLNSKTNLERAERYLSRIAGVGRGGRDCHTHKVAASVVRDFGLDEDTGFRLMASWNEVNNDPPLHDDDIKRIVRSVLEHGRHPIGNKL